MIITEQHSSVAIITHGTACSYYLTLDPKRIDAAHACNDRVLDRGSSLVTVLRGVNLAYPGFGGTPIELLVPREAQYRNDARCTVHSCREPLPSGSFWKFSDRLYISSPELCFVQMAQSLSVAKLSVLGSDLCAQYYIEPETDKLEERQSITTRSSLARYIESVKGMKGSGKARKALAWIADGSASPWETKTHAITRIPLCFGGYGFPEAVFNYRVDPGRYAYLVEQGFFKIDIGWPTSKVGLEYYGEDEHADSIHDRRRLDALEALGWKMVVIDKQRLRDPDAFDIAMRQLARHLQRRIRKPQNWVEKNLALRREIGIE